MDGRSRLFTQWRTGPLRASRAVALPRTKCNDGMPETRCWAPRRSAAVQAQRYSGWQQRWTRRKVEKYALIGNRFEAFSERGSIGCQRGGRCRLGQSGRDVGRPFDGRHSPPKQGALPGRRCRRVSASRNRNFESISLQRRVLQTRWSRRISRSCVGSWSPIALRVSA
jgi:hypothetical protein